MLAARSEDAIKDAVSRIRTAGGDVIAVACDVADQEQVQRLAGAAVSQYGRIDTWVNNAGLGGLCLCVHQPHC